MTQNNIERREMLKRLCLVTGYTFTVGATSAFIAGCKSDSTSSNASQSTASVGSTKSIFSKDQMDVISEVAERILPKNETPGAKDANVQEYISQAVSLFFKKEDQERFVKNLGSFDKLATDKYKKIFVELTDANKDDVLKILAEEWKKGKDLKDAPPHIFKEMRDLTVTGFCTSEVGAKQLLKYDELPGPYQGCIDRASVGGVYAL
ncbi:MAG: hypothetical protein RLZZ546_894 [Bacteroidota bacterium]|jgi:hypothetical protein